MSTARIRARRGARKLVNYASGLVAAIALFILGRPGQATAISQGPGDDGHARPDRGQAVDQVAYVDVTDLGEGFGQPYPKPLAE